MSAYSNIRKKISDAMAQGANCVMIEIDAVEENTLMKKSFSCNNNIVIVNSIKYYVYKIVNEKKNVAINQMGTHTHNIWNEINKPDSLEQINKIYEGYRQTGNWNMPFNSIYTK